MSVVTVKFYDIKVVSPNIIHHIKLCCSCWRKGGSCSLKEIANLLSADEKSQLRDSDGGLQTFLRNQHQIFKVRYELSQFFKEVGGSVILSSFCLTESEFLKLHFCFLIAEFRLISNDEVIPDS